MKSHESDEGYRCPKCGATSALLMPEPFRLRVSAGGQVLHQGNVALKCLQCAHVLRMPRHLLEGASPRLGSTSSLE